MVAILKFKLPDERAEYQMASQGADYHSVILELDQWLRAEVKYNELSKEKAEAYEQCRQVIRDLMEERKCNYTS